MKAILDILKTYKKLKRGHVEGGLLLILPTILSYFNLKDITTPEIIEAVTVLANIFGFSLVAKTDLKK